MWQIEANVGAGIQVSATSIRAGIGRLAPKSPVGTSKPFQPVQQSEAIDQTSASALEERLRAIQARLVRDERERRFWALLNETYGTRMSYGLLAMGIAIPLYILGQNSAAASRDPILATAGFFVLF